MSEVKVVRGGEEPKFETTKFLPTRCRPVNLKPNFSPPRLPGFFYWGQQRYSFTSREYHEMIIETFHDLFLLQVCQVVHSDKAMVRRPHLPGDRHPVRADKLLHGDLHGPGRDTQGQP